MRSGPYRLFFYSTEGDEAPHVHVERGRSTVKFWLEPVELAGRSRFRNHEVERIRRIVMEGRIKLLEDWYEHFAG